MAHRVAGDHVSIHALVRRATSSGPGGHRPRTCFDPRPRAEGDQGEAQILDVMEVSIHALVRRATRSLAPRVTRHGPFRSTPSCGGRQSAAFLDRFTIWVSIHALVRRATSECRTTITTSARFRSTPSCGGRPPARPVPMCRTCFDPRPRAEGDRRPRADAGPAALVSIHALVRRATTLTWAAYSGRSRFDPRPRAEGDEAKQVAIRG